MTPRLLYTSFDQIPAPKGASTHIREFVTALGAHFGHVTLVTPAERDAGPKPLGPAVTQVEFGCPDDNPIGRARTFRAKLSAWLESRQFDLIHFRSIFEGYPLIRPEVRRGARLVYEANGFPSVELKYHHRRLLNDRALMEKLVLQEQRCLEAADRIIVVSEVTRNMILARGLAADRVTLIRNGVDPERFAFLPNRTDHGSFQVLYTGTMTAWQGVETLIEAVDLLKKHREDVRLRLIGPVSKSRRATLDQLIAKFKLGESVEFLPGSGQNSVVRHFHSSHVSVVPLIPVDRNTQQGCCPLKLLESMFAGCPVVASDLPVVRELANPWEHFVPARPGDARNLKNAILALADDPAAAGQIAQRAYDRVSTRCTWKQSTARLIALYDDLLNGKSGH